MPLMLKRSILYILSLYVLECHIAFTCIFSSWTGLKCWLEFHFYYIPIHFVFLQKEITTILNSHNTAFLSLQKLYTSFIKT